MSEQKNIIKLNGKTYDAKTGVLVGHGSAKKAAHPVQPHKKHPVAPVVPAATKSVTSSHPRHAAASVHKRKQRSQTLMRGAVKQPVLIGKAPVSGALDTGSSLRIIEPESRLQGSNTRDERVKKVKKSKLITRFGNFAGGPSFIMRSEPIAVTPLPQAPPVHSSQRTDRTESTPDFNAAIHHATSHEQPIHKHPRRAHKAARKLGVSNKTFNASAAVIAIVLLVGFYAYQNKAGSEFRVAASKAGIHTSLPGYTPAGYAISGPVQYQPGEVTVSFKSNSDDRNFSLSQQSSNWNSDALAANLSGSTSGNYNTVQDGNKTIFVDQNSNASWVKDGILYEINGDSTLSTDQLLKIVNSL